MDFFYFCVELCFPWQQKARAVALRFPPMGTLDGLTEHGLSHILRAGAPFQRFQEKVRVGSSQFCQRGAFLHIPAVHFPFDEDPGKAVIGALPHIPSPGIEQGLQGVPTEKVLCQSRDGVHI